ncbi:cell adhesion molecule 3-like [Megalops cyprinoides]|uniref:cell adhesion molecule 3-like n=1 Tax=Megalops cyprinoides TaxID=118141 RepID=UPI001863DC68|nr:cell adhesion molecule 3-like [Megalops cyprinoides]
MRSEKLLCLLQLLHAVYGECPVQLHPSSLVVRYGDSASANCTVSEGHLGIGWEASEGSVNMVQDVQFVTWKVENLRDWHIEPNCFVNFMKGAEYQQCVEALQVTLYKTPDSVSISSVDHTGPMVEGRQYQLRCEVQNIAPVQNVTVKWYQGEKGSTKGERSFDSITKTPANVASTLTITPSRTDNGVQYSCVAKLELGPEGPQTPTEVTSEPLKITVHYAPEFTCDYSYEVTEKQNYTLNCTVVGHPVPEVTWMKQGKKVELPPHLSKKDAGLYTLIATNTYGTVNHTLEIKVVSSREVNVITISVVVFLLVVVSFLCIIGLYMWRKN